MQKLATSVSSSAITQDLVRPILLVHTDENGSLKIDPEATDALRQLKGPVAVVYVCGRAREGNSIILNQFLCRSNRFQVASTDQRRSKSLWMWIAPSKRIDPDGTEYNLLLLDSEGIDSGYEKGTWSFQIFSLVVRLSTMFIYNQIGDIDEATLDHLSLVTEHVRIGPDGDRKLSELREFSPLFVWLLMDFHLDSVEENVRLTPCDYSELALEPVPGRGQEIASKNKIQEYIRCLFPNQECFTLPHPSDKETDLQHLDQILLENLCPEFSSRLDAFAKFVVERTRPKQVGGTIMTGPILAGITEHFVEALSNGGVLPTITSSWQHVEESECRRAYEMATQVYISSFDRTKPPEEVLIKEAQDEAVHKATVAFDESAVRTGSTRQNYEGLLQNFFRKAFEDYQRIASKEADLRRSKAIEDMVPKLQAVSQTPDTNIDNVTMVLDGLLAEYEASVHGPAKQQKLSSFLRKSLQDVLAHDKNHIAKVLSENSNLTLKCRSMEDTIDLLKKQLEGSEKFKKEYEKHYEDAINDLNKLSDCYKNRISNLESKCRSLEDRCSHLAETLEPTRLEALGWQKKYDKILTEKNMGDARANAEIALLKSKGAVTEAGVAAGYEQACTARKEANEWKIKYESAVSEAKAALEKAMTMEESLKLAQVREEAMRAEFSSNLDKKVKEIKDKAEEIASSEQQLATLRSEFKNAEHKIASFNLESSNLKVEIRELDEKYQTVKSVAETLEREVLTLRKEKTQLEEVSRRLKASETEFIKVKELADSLKAEALAAQNKESELQQLVQEKGMELEKAKACIENLEKKTRALLGEIKMLRLEKLDSVSNIVCLETRIKETEEEMESLKKTKCGPKENTCGAYDNLRNEVAYGFDPNPKTPLGKRSRLEAMDSSGLDSVQDTDIEEDLVMKEEKKSKNSLTLEKCSNTEGGSSSGVNHAKLTVVKLRREIIKHGFGAELLQLKSPRKKDLLDLYEKCGLGK